AILLLKGLNLFGSDLGNHHLVVLIPIGILLVDCSNQIGHVVVVDVLRFFHQFVVKVETNISSVDHVQKKGWNGIVGECRFGGLDVGTDDWSTNIGGDRGGGLILL